MYRPQPPPRVDTTTTSKLPRDPSDWVDEELVSYVKSHYSASESLSAVELIRGKRLTPRTLWYLQTDHDALAELTSEESLHQFVLALAQSIHPAVSPTTPRVKHIRRLSEDFAHPPPPPTPPPPSPSLPEESELEEDDDVAESVISDWALDGDNDEIHEAREAPPADATRAEDTREPADAQHAEPTTGESSLGLDIGGEPTQSSEPVEPPPQPALSTTSTEESLIDFEDAPETISRASPEPSVDAATGAQPPEVDTARHGSADPQVTEEPAAVLLAEPEGASLSVNVPDATEEPPSDTSNRDDPPLADEGASAGAGPDGMPGMSAFDDPWAQHDESEAHVEPLASEETVTSNMDRPDERTDSELHPEVDTSRESAAPTESGLSTSPSRAEGTTELAGPEATDDVSAEVKSGDAPRVEGEESKPAAEIGDKDLPTPPESPEDAPSAEQPASSTPAIQAHTISLSGDYHGETSRDDEHADHRDMFSTPQQDEEPLVEGAPTVVQQATGTLPATEVVESVSQEEPSPESSSSRVAVAPETQPAGEAPSGDKRLEHDGDRGRSTLVTLSKDPLLTPGTGSTPGTLATDIPPGSAAASQETESNRQTKPSSATAAGETPSGNEEDEDAEGEAEVDAEVETQGGQHVAEAGEEEGTRGLGAPVRAESENRPNSTSVAEVPKMEGDSADHVHVDTPPAPPSDVHEGDDLSGQTASAEPLEPSDKQRGFISSLSSVKSMASSKVSSSSISPTVTLASGAEVLIVGRDPDREDERGKTTIFPVPSPAAVAIAVTTPPTGVHPPVKAQSELAPRPSSAPWPASPGVHARASRSPPPLKTDFHFPATSERDGGTIPRSALFSPQRQIPLQTPPSSTPKSPAWGITARSLFSSVTSAFSPLTPHSSPPSTRDSSQEPAPVPRAGTRTTPPARTQVAWGANRQWSPVVSSPSFGQAHAPSPSPPRVVEQRPDQTTSFQPAAKGEPAQAVEKELSEAMNGGIPGLQEERLQQSDRLDLQAGPSTQEASKPPESKSGDGDLEDFVQVGLSDLAGENSTSDNVKHDEAATSEDVLSSGHVGGPTTGDECSKQSNCDDANEDTPLSQVSRFLKATPQTPSSEPTSDVEEEVDGPESPLESPAVQRLRTFTGDDSEGPDSPSVDASDNPAETDDTPGTANVTKKKKPRNKKKKGRRS